MAFTTTFVAKRVGVNGSSGPEAKLQPPIQINGLVNERRISPLLSAFYDPTVTQLWGSGQHRSPTREEKSKLSDTVSSVLRWETQVSSIVS